MFSLKRLYSNVAVNFLLGALLAPNLVFLLLWIEYAPRRFSFVINYFLIYIILVGIAYLGRAGPRLVVFIFLIYCFILFLDVLRFLESFFGIHQLDLLYSIPNVLDLNIFSYGPYIAGLLLIGLQLLLTFYAYYRCQIVFQKGALDRRAVAVCLSMTAVFFAADIYLNNNLNYKIDLIDAASDQVEASSGAGRISAATEQAAWFEQIDPESDNLLVIVESLGVINNRRIAEALGGHLITSEVKKRYKTSIGTVKFNGSTTAGEQRELCKIKRNLSELKSGKVKASNCLPVLFQAKGFEVTAYHGFTGKFFDRVLWYPHIGLNNSVFLEDFSAKMNGLNRADLCGGTFRGLCDRIVGKAVKEAFTERPEKPKFIYWLTLNSHFPAKKETGHGNRFDCKPYPELDEQLCTMAGFWAEVLEIVKDIALTKTGRRLNIVVVGDHGPPLLRRKNRKLFSDNLVPYFVLRGS